MHTREWRSVSSSNLPAYDTLLTGDGGSVALPANDRSDCALVRLMDGRYALIASSRDVPAVAALLRSCTTRNWDVSFLYETSKDSIAALYHSFIAADRIRPNADIRTDTDIRIDNLFADAIAKGASDIHIDTEPATGTISYRIHNVLVPQKQVSSHELVTFSSTIYTRCDPSTRVGDFNPKYMQGAKMNLNLPSKGSFRIRYQHAPKDPDCLSVRLRILSVEASSAITDFEAAGYSSSHASVLEKIIRSPDGLLLVCGPMGSGKSTTLKIMSEAIYDLNEGDVNIHFFEDPVEYRIRGAKQTSISATLDASTKEEQWESAFRAAMRLDVNILGVGEIRDSTAARYCVEFAETGHLVLSSLHSTNVVYAIQRLLDWGCNPSVILQDGFIRGVMYVRLVQCVCQNCAIPLPDSKSSRRERISLFLSQRFPGLDLATIRTKGPGCDQCNFSGLIGRTQIAEILVPDAEILKLIRDGNLDGAISKWRAGQNSKSSNLTLLEHALSKVVTGMICPVALDRRVITLEPSTLVPEEFAGNATLGVVVPFAREEK